MDLNTQEAFLLLPQGQAALMNRGIVWHLAIEILGDNNAVLEGPSVDVLTHGHCVKLSNGDELGDDDCPLRSFILFVVATMGQLVSLFTKCLVIMS
jgi:hypothetical protein